MAFSMPVILRITLGIFKQTRLNFCPGRAFTQEEDEDKQIEETVEHKKG